MNRVDHLERTASAMEDELAVVRNVNTLLSHQLDVADSYSHRSCMIIKGLRKFENSETKKQDRLNIISANGKEAGIDENDFRMHVDKIHLIGHAKMETKQKL